MRLASESLQGVHGMDGIAHVRVYEAPGQVPVVIAGQLGDNPGTHVTMAVEMVAASIHENLFPDGREFRLVSYEPCDMLGNSWFRLIEFEHRAVSEDPGGASHYTGTILFLDDAGEELSVRGTEEYGDFREPRWRHVEDPAELVGCGVQTWPRGEYTVDVVFGEAGEALRAKTVANARLQGQGLRDLLEG